MCGIAGIIDYRKMQIDEGQINQMTNMLEHRGPDSKGIYRQPGIALSHRRLAIIDLSDAARQPIPNETEDIFTAVNGMIYNFEDLRANLEDKGHSFRSRSDSEVTVHLYEEYGEDSFSMLRGMYSIAIWDAKKEVLWLVRDRIGQKPLVYAELPDRFYFASEVKAILATGEVSKEMDMTGLHHLFSYMATPWPYTMYRMIKQLPPASILRISLKDHSIKIKKYWNLNIHDKILISEEEAAEKVFHLLKDSVRLRLRSDVGFGALLSGGMDSSAVVALMNSILNQPIKTYSVGFSDSSFKDPEFDFSSQIAKRFSTNHHQVIVDHTIIDMLPKMLWHYDEPYTNPVALANFKLCRVIKKDLSVTLSGDGSDEVFAGYPGYRKWAMLHLLNSIIPLKLGYTQRAVRKTAFSRYLFDNLYSDCAKEMIKESDSGKILNEFLHKNNADSLVDKILYMDLALYNLHGICTFSDISGMATGLEIRSPFLDHRLIELSFSLPSKLKTGVFSHTKNILRKALKGLLPEEILYRKKMSYGEGIPFKRWFNNQWREEVINALFDGTLNNTRIFNMRYIDNLYSQHIREKKDNFLMLWALFCFSVWHSNKSNC